MYLFTDADAYGVKPVANLGDDIARTSGGTPFFRLQNLGGMPVPMTLMIATWLPDGGGRLQTYEIGRDVLLITPLAARLPWCCRPALPEEITTSFKPSQSRRKRWIGSLKTAFSWKALSA